MIGSEFCATQTCFLPETSGIRFRFLCWGHPRPPKVPGPKGLFEWVLVKSLRLPAGASEAGSLCGVLLCSRGPRGRAVALGGDGILALVWLAGLARGTAAVSPARCRQRRQPGLLAPGLAAGPGRGVASRKRAEKRSSGVSPWPRQPRALRAARLRPGCSLVPVFLASPSPGRGRKEGGTDGPPDAARTCGTGGAGGGARPPPLGRGQRCAPRARRGGTGGAASSQPHLTLAAARAGGRRRGLSGSRSPHEVSPSRCCSSLSHSAHPRCTDRRCGDARLGTPAEDPGTSLSEDGKARQVDGNATCK